MRRVVAVIAVVMVALTIVGTAQVGPVDSSAQRKVIARVAPVYPELARKLHMQGVVKVEAVVRTNGTVKETRVLGGNPVLVEPARDAVRKWKFEPGPSETTELVQLKFAPE